MRLVATFSQFNRFFGFFYTHAHTRTQSVSGSCVLISDWYEVERMRRRAQLLQGRSQHTPMQPHTQNGHHMPAVQQHSNRWQAWLALGLVWLTFTNIWLF
jgi:hypothetical protein